MCGIAGYFDQAGASTAARDILTEMARRLRPRGPDGHGHWTDTTGHAGFAHTRLAIMDPHGVGSGQPMFNPPRSGADPRILALVFGGEIYNYRQLRTQLAATGHQFVTDGDTEVILHAYTEWGDQLVEHLTGMFAFALWDGTRQRLLLARDHLGVKPLFFYQLPDQRGVVFGSEVKALRAHPDVPATINTTGLNELFTMAPMRTPGLTPLTGVRELLPGHLLTVDRDGVHEQQYWTLTAAEHPHNSADTIAHVRHLLEEAVAGQTYAHRRIGLLLSGGIDSSALAALAARNPDMGQLPSFCIDYPPSAGPAYAASPLHVDSDAKWAAQVAAHLGLDHHPITVTTDAMDAMAAATLTAMDFPSIAHVNVPLAALMREISAHVPVVLGGEGADEAFGGYSMHHHGSQPDQAGRWPWATTYPTPAWLLTADARTEMRPGNYLAERYAQARELVPVLSGEPQPVRRRRVTNHMIITHYLNFLLARADRLSMLSGVEVRVPFCDPTIMQYAFNIPPTLLDGTTEASAMPKWLLRQATADLLPPGVVWRPKSGFPVGQTVDGQKHTWQQLRERLTTDGPISSILDQKAILAMLDRTEGDVSRSWNPMLHAGLINELLVWEQTAGVTLA